MTNYAKGYRLENLIVQSMRNDGFLSERFHKSIGPHWKYDYDRVIVKDKAEHYGTKHAPIDVWWLDAEKYNLAQCKNNTKISTDEMLDLVLFAMDYPQANTWLITKMNRKLYHWKLSNHYINP